MTRTITRSKVHHAGHGVSRDPNDHRNLKDAQSRMHRMYGDENVARCHRCPRQAFCKTCDGLNRSRIQLGLIRPKHQGDHANNILYATPINKKVRMKAVPQLRYTRASARLIGCRVKPLNGGWYQATATIDGFVIEQSEKVRSHEQATAWAQAKVAEIHDNMAMGISYDV